MGSFEKIMGLDAESPEMMRANLLAESNRELLRRLIQIRKDRGLSQEDVAELLGLKQSTIAKFEGHNSNPTLGTIARYAHAVRALVSYHVEPDEG